MTADQSDDNRPSFEELIKRQLDPLYQQDLLIESVNQIASVADLVSQQKLREEWQAIVDKRLDQFNVYETLKQIKKTAWRRGSIVPIEEDVVMIGGGPKFRMQTGLRLSYACLGVAVILDGNTVMSSPTLNHGFYMDRGYDAYNYLAISEAQRIDVRAVPSQGQETVLEVKSYSLLNVPDYVERGKRILPNFYSGIAYKDGEIFEDPLVGYSMRDAEPRLRVAEVGGYGHYEALLDLKQNDPVSLFDEFLVQDCVERFNKDKLPLKARGYWSRFIYKYDIHDLFVRSKLMLLDPRNIQGNPTTSPDEVEGFKARLRDAYGVELDDIIEWMREGPGYGEIALASNFPNRFLGDKEAINTAVKNGVLEALSNFRQLVPVSPLTPISPELAYRIDPSMIKLLQLGGHFFQMGSWTIFEKLSKKYPEVNIKI